MGIRKAEQPDPLALAAITLHLVRLWAPARSVALLACEHAGLRLVLSDLIDQGALDDARALWPELPLELIEGVAYRGRGSRDFLVLPCLVHGHVRGLLYLETADAAVIRPPRQLRALADVLATTLQGGDAAPAPATQREAGRVEAVVDLQDSADLANLMALLERHEWNISRVGRLLGVTRATVYNRLNRGHVRPVRVRRSERRPKRRTDGQASLPGGAPVDLLPPAGAPPVRTGLVEGEAALARSQA